MEKEIKNVENEEKRELTIFDSENKKVYCSKVIETEEEKKEMFNALESCDILLNDCVNNEIELKDIYIEERNVNNTGVLSIKKSILSILGEESNLNMDNIDFLEQMSHYITKIRKYAINKKTYNLNSDPRNLIKYNEGDIVSDAILNKINIVSKELHDNILHIKVKSKSGEYNFKFKKA